MANSSSVSLMSGALVLSIIGAAAGLNLTIMSIGAAEPPDEAAIATTTVIGSEVRQVVVDVPVPINTEPERTSSAAVPLPAAQAPSATLAPTLAAAPTTASTLTVRPTTSAPTTAPTATPEPTAAASTTQPTDAPPGTKYLTFEFDGVATIVVAYHDGKAIEFWSATPEDGWAFMVEKNEYDEVELKFRRVSGSEAEAKFDVSLEDGEIEVKTER